MSYCRFSDGDVYMFSCEVGIECQSCALMPKCKTIFTALCENCGGEGCDSCMFFHESAIFKSAKDALKHLLEHRAAGHSVPQYAIDALTAEAKDEEEAAHA